MHISYFLGTKADYIQVVSHRDQDKELKELGFVRSVDDLPDDTGSSEEPVVHEISQSDLRDSINDCQDKSELEDLMLSLGIINLDKRKSLDNMKADALQAIS